MIKKLRLKFIAVNMTIVMIMLITIFGLIFHFTSTNLQNESIRMMRTLLSKPSNPKPLPPDMKEKNIRLPFFILTLDNEGSLVSSEGNFFDLSDKGFLNELIEEVNSSKKETGTISKYNLRYIKQNSPFENRLIFSDISSEISTLNNLIKNFVLIGILSFFAFLFITIIISKWAVKPVEDALKQQRQFVSDASHELKTPLTVILTNSELAQSELYSETEKMKFISNINTVSKHMKVLVEQLLELARADNTDKNINTSQFSFSSLIKNTILSFEVVLFEAGHVVSENIEENINITANELQLRQVIEILLDNAGKYSSHNGNIFVTLKKHGSCHCIFTVSNEGEPINAEELKNIFKRFYRLDQSRSRNGSFGLGLSIAETIVLKHKGKIWAESEGGINSFHVQLPCE